jgi:hypothetical protein
MWVSGGVENAVEIGQEGEVEPLRGIKIINNINYSD